LAISASLQKRLGSFNKAWTAVSPWASGKSTLAPWSRSATTDSSALALSATCSNVSPSCVQKGGRRPKKGGGWGLFKKRTGRPEDLSRSRTKRSWFRSTPVFRSSAKPTTLLDTAAFRNRRLMSAVAILF
jgi:hypothetical protein